MTSKLYLKTTLEVLPAAIECLEGKCNKSDASYKLLGCKNPLLRAIKVNFENPSFEDLKAEIARIMNDETSVPKSSTAMQAQV